MLDAFREGGWGMVPTLCCGVLAIAVAVRYAVRPEKRLVPLLVSTNVLTLLAGALGFVTGVIKATTGLSPTTNTTFALIGVGESLQNVALALVLMALAAIATSVGAFGVARAHEA